MQTQSLAQIVIVGGGFGGLSAAKELAGKGVGVTLIDKTNHHLFQPLLYQVATAGLSPADIAQPIRHILKDAKNIQVVMGEAASIDPDSRHVRTITFNRGARLIYGSFRPKNEPLAETAVPFGPIQSDTRNHSVIAAGSKEEIEPKLS